MKDLDLWGKTTNDFRAIAAFMGERPLREHFMAEQLQHTPEYYMFEQWSIGKKFTLKWEYFERFMRNISVVLTVLQQGSFSDPASIEKRAKYYADVINDVRDVVKKPVLLGFCYLLKAVSHILLKIGSSCEGCWCHDYILEDTAEPYAKRLARWRRLSRDCIWKGRRAGLLATGIMHKFAEEFRNCSSLEYRTILATCPPDVRDTLMLARLQLLPKLAAVLLDGCIHWSHIPYRLMAAVNYVYAAMTLAASKQVVRERLQEREDAICRGEKKENASRGNSPYV